MGGFHRRGQIPFVPKGSLEIMWHDQHSIHEGKHDSNMFKMAILHPPIKVNKHPKDTNKKHLFKDTSG